MMYQVIPGNPPSVLLDGWELLLSEFGTEPFSGKAGTEVLEDTYPDLRGNLDEVLVAYTKLGSLTVIEKEI